MDPARRIFVAVDTPDRERALELVASLSGAVGGYKIGLELFSSHGPELVRVVRERGGEVFLDLKLYDIPNTVAGAAAAAGRLGVSFFTVHASGGTEMIRRAVEASAAGAAERGLPAPVVLAVTVLTSHDDTLLESVGLSGPCAAAVSRLAGVARDGGAGGIVCSPLEIEKVREVFPDATLVVPGIRPAAGTVTRDDQARTATPAGAVARGADLLVIGRPITRADDPPAAARAIAVEIAETDRS